METWEPQEWEHKIVVATGLMQPRIAESSLAAEEAGGWELVSAIPRHERDQDAVWPVFKRRLGPGKVRIAESDTPVPVTHEERRPPQHKDLLRASRKCQDRRSPFGEHVWGEGDTFRYCNHTRAWAEGEIKDEQLPR